MISIPKQYGSIIQKMMQNSQKQHVIDETNVWQEGNTVNRHLFYEIVDDLLLPGSQVVGMEHVVELYRQAQAGKACLLLCEHYSNFDLPSLFTLIERGHAEGKQIAESLVAIAGFKLNESSPVVLAFAEAFSRIIIYPSRSIEALPDGDEKEAELKRAQKINLASMKALSKAKTTGKIVLVFPSGTRYRPGKPETKKGVREIDSYIKSFDSMVMLSINGNTLTISSDASAEMTDDMARRDVILYGASPVLDCNEFRKQAQEACPPDQDPKQFTVDRVMAELDRLHEVHEPIRQSLLPKE
ncbi:MAG: 1-acyl-sn-glycerol-3-phosphate acyltransferase [Spirochaetales bacterium]